MHKDIFISYSSKDESIVLEVISMLRQYNISYWFAPEQLTGKKHDEEIVPAIKYCKVFMIFLSSNSRPRDGVKTSSWVRDELLTAREYESCILPIKLDETVDLETNNLMFKGLPNYFDLTSNNLISLKEYLDFFLIDENYKSAKFKIENISKTKAKTLFEEIEQKLKHNFIKDAEDILLKNTFLKDIDYFYEKLLHTIVLMSKQSIKDMQFEDIVNIVENLKSLELSDYKNVSFYLQSMIAKSYFEFNGIANNLTLDFNTLKRKSEHLGFIKAKYFLMTRGIKNIIPYESYEIKWI